MGENRKIAYEAYYRRMAEEDSPFDEDEILPPGGSNYQHFVAQVRFRQQVWRPWFYVELWPIVAWPQERDYDTILAGRLRLEINLGGTGDERLDE